MKPVLERTVSRLEPEKRSTASMPRSPGRSASALIMRRSTSSFVSRPCEGADHCSSYT